MSNHTAEDSKPSDSSISAATTTNGVNGTAVTLPPSDPAPKNGTLKLPADGDDDPHNLIIASLRAQNNELFSQVTALNAKLVKSYDRVSDLEDSAHLTQAQIRQASLRISELELERLDHMKAVNTGLLVEREHVTSELTRLMEKVTEEAARRGQAESARSEIEKDLDDLSATLFDQANTMVAQARFAAAKSERKVAESELALKGAEEAVSLMQTQMQTLTESKEKAEAEVDQLRELTAKGKWVERPESLRRASSIILGLNGGLPRLMSGHLPFEEFLLFVAHLRGTRAVAPQAPAFSSLFALPFLSRLIAEDSDPTLRLDLAPSLNWLTRRSIQAAVQQGQLQVEPLSATSFLIETTSHVHGVPPNPTNAADVTCAMCGKAVFPASMFATPPSAWKEAHPPPPHHPATTRPSLSGSTSAAWMTSTSRFLKSNINLPSLTSSSQQSNNAGSRSTTAPSTPTIPPSPFSQYQVFIFRLSLPPPQQRTGAPYPLCYSGWCLFRLRTTCELWRYVRKDIVDRVWEEEPLSGAITTPAPSRRGSAITGLGSMVGSKVLRSNSQSAPTNDSSTPPVPPRRNLGTGMAKVGSFFEKGLGALGVAPIPVTVPPPVPPRSAASEPDRTDPPSDAGTAPSSNHAQAKPPPSTAETTPPPIPTRSRSRVPTGSPTATPIATKRALPPLPSKPSNSPAAGSATPAPDPPAQASNTVTDEDKALAAVIPEKVDTGTIDLTDEPISKLPQPTQTQPETTSPVPQTQIGAADAAPPAPGGDSPVSPPRTTPVSPATPRKGTPPLGLRHPVDAGGSSSPGAPPPVPRRAAARRALPTPGTGSRPGSPALPARTTGSRPSSPAPANPPHLLQRPGSPGPPNHPGTPTRNTKRLSTPKLGLILGAKEHDLKIKRNSIDAVLAGESPSVPVAEEVPQVESPEQVLSQVVKDESPLPAKAPPSDNPTEPKDTVQEVSFSNTMVVNPTPSTEASRSTDSFASALAAPAESKTPTVPPTPAKGGSTDTVKALDSTPPSDDVALLSVHKKQDAEAQSVSSVYSKTIDGDEKLERDELEDALGNFVGDKTWEERAWKELVRLRTEMYWARVGTSTV